MKMAPLNDAGARVFRARARRRVEDRLDNGFMLDAEANRMMVEVQRQVHGDVGVLVRDGVWENTGLAPHLHVRMVVRGRVEGWAAPTE
jgi:hypothetical protein